MQIYSKSSFKRNCIKNHIQKNLIHQRMGKKKYISENIKKESNRKWINYIKLKRKKKKN